MATPRDIPGGRPSSHGSSTASSVPVRQSNSRHAHSLSLGAFNPDHRVTRRKSVNTNASAGALRATLNEEGASRSHRRSMPGKTAASDAYDESAVADDAGSVPAATSTKARARRASEGSGKRASREVKCEKCGKGYKHSSCLTKHLWEHTPEWALTSKLLISKHQQVQLLEAATVLVGMNQDVSEEAVNSDNSASPAASGSSGLPDDDDEYSSAETTPPPMSEHYGGARDISRGSKRYSGNSSSFSRSYQSAPSTSWSNQASGGFQNADEEEASLAAAVQSLCSFGTPRNGPVLLPADVPPVPPLPAQFKSFPVGGKPGVTVREVQDVEMGEVRREAEDYDDGFFGRMEGLAPEVQENLSYARSS